MIIYDISQEVLGCDVYPGDPAPCCEALMSIKDGELYNLSVLRMCLHNGTHVDAPSHFIGDGKTVDEMDLKRVIGMAFVAEHHGMVTARDAEQILRRAKEQMIESAKRILIKGEAVVSLEAAKVFADEGIYLLGNESQSVGPEEAPMQVHLQLLGSEVALLEGIRLADVPEGMYLLNAAPLSIRGAEGAPCRAVLIKTD